MKKFQEDKVQAKQIRREEKMKRRNVNIEIASELIDLIMDVADEAYDYQEGHKEEESEESRLMLKQTWRRWMDVFVDGKMVSE